MFRGQGGEGRRWLEKAVLFGLAGTVGASLTGAALGQLGGFLSLQGRLGIASLLGSLAVVFGTLDLLGRRVPLLQCNRETPQRWVHFGPATWAVVNGAALGVGATTRVGFWLWYTVPATAFLLATPVAGTLLYGFYGFVRGFGSLGLIAIGGVLRDRRRIGFDEIALWLISRYPHARAVAAGYLLVVGVAVVISVGL